MTVALSFALVQAEVDAGLLLDFLEEHCAYVAGHLEETGAIRTNHYAADLCGIVVAGALFPELAGGIASSRAGSGTRIRASAAPTART